MRSVEIYRKGRVEGLRVALPLDGEDHDPPGALRTTSDQLRPITASRAKADSDSLSARDTPKAEREGRGVEQVDVDDLAGLVNLRT